MFGLFISLSDLTVPHATLGIFIQKIMLFGSLQHSLSFAEIGTLDVQ